MFATEYLAPSFVSWLTTLGVSSVYTRECMFHILSHFKSVWLGFEPLKVGSLLFSYFCNLHTFLGSPVWHAITLTQLTKMLKFLFCCIINVRDMLCFKFQLMMNLFDQFSNTILNAICNFLLVSRNVDWLVPLFEMS